MATNNYTLGRGRISIAAFVEGTQVPGVFRYLGNSPAIGFTITSDVLNHMSSDDEIREIDTSANTQVTRTGTFQVDNFSSENLALFLSGTATQLVGTASTGTVSPSYTVSVGDQIKLGVSAENPGGTPGITNVTCSDTAATFTFDATSGMVTITGAPTANPVTFTYDTTATTIAQAQSGTTSFVGALQYVAKNGAGRDINYYMPYVRITPNGELALKGDTWQVMGFNISIMKLDGGQAIYADDGSTNDIP